MQEALEALEALALLPADDYRATPEEFEKYRRQALDEVAGLCGDEKAIAAANFRRSGRGGKELPEGLDGRLASFGLGALARKGSALLRRGRAEKLPIRLLLAVTPKRVYAFDASYRYSMRRRRRETGRPVEVAVWDRNAVRIEVGKPAPMSTLRIEPLDGAAVITLAGPSTADDPWSRALMALLDPTPTAAR